MISQILIATPGSEPQVATLTPDTLRAKGYAIAEVNVVYTIERAIHPALRALQEAFAGPEDMPPTPHARRRGLRSPHRGHCYRSRHNRPAAHPLSGGASAETRWADGSPEHLRRPQAHGHVRDGGGSTAARRGRPSVASALEGMTTG